MFRDESERIIRKARTLHEENQIEQPRSSVMQNAVTALSTASAFSASLLPTSISHALSQPINEIGAHFFFANYSCNELPLSEDYHAWLTQMYCEGRSNHALRAAIEAVGMAGISNIFYAPDVASKSKEQYGRALAATMQALSHPVEAVADTTFVTVILLGLFEFMTIENWDHYRSWAAHIKGAMALLQLRGQEQFNYERGRQLFKQLRSHILYDCMQQDVAAPQALLQISHNLKTSAMDERSKKIQPGPIGDMCFRLLDLRAAIKSRDITDPKAIREAAIEMDGELEAWRAALPPCWSYATVDAGDAPAGTYFGGKRQIYSNLWTAQVLNNWRTLRILINRVILQNAIRSDAPDSAHESTALSLIHQLSTEICISAPNFIGSPRSAGLIWPIFVVSQEHLNPRSERCWAVEQLRRISSSMGIRQAGLLADTISQSLNGSQGNFANMEQQAVLSHQSVSPNCTSPSDLSTPMHRTSFSEYCKEI